MFEIIIPHKGGGGKREVGGGGWGGGGGSLIFQGILFVVAPDTIVFIC